MCDSTIKALVYHIHPTMVSKGTMKYTLEHATQKKRILTLVGEAGVEGGRGRGRPG